jgi:hypothetical protein
VNLFISSIKRGIIDFLTLWWSWGVVWSSWGVFVLEDGYWCSSQTVLNKNSITDSGGG